MNTTCKQCGQREAAEDRADAEAGKRALAKWEANGRPASIPADEVKRQLGIK